MEQHQKVFAVYAPARYTVTRPDRQSSSHSIEIAANMWQPRALHTHTIFQVTSTTARCLTLHSGVQFLVRNAFSPHWGDHNFWFLPRHEWYYAGFSLSSWACLAVAFGVSYIMIFMQEVAYVFVELKYQKITTTTVFVSFYFLLDCIALSLFARELFHCRYLLICFDGVHLLE